MSEEVREKRTRRSKSEMNELRTPYQRLSEKFPEKFLKRRIINQGTSDERVIEYIGGDKVIERLNEIIGLGWNFEIVDKIVDIDIGQIAVLGRLSADIGGVKVVKEQWGSSAIDTYPNGRVISLGDNIKAATTDALKKCATRIGVGLYLYDSESMKFPEQSYVPPVTKAKEVSVEKIRDSLDKKASKAQVSTIIKIIKDNELDESAVKQKYSVEKISDMSNSSASEFIVRWRELFTKQDSSNSAQ